MSGSFWLHILLGGNAFAENWGCKAARSDRGDVRFYDSFRTPTVMYVFTRTAPGVRKPPRNETAGRGTYWAVPCTELWGFVRGRATAKVGAAAG